MNRQASRAGTSRITRATRRRSAPAGSRKAWGLRGALLASAAVLAGTALVVHRRARQAERANPPVGRFIEIDGVRLHYVERGEGRPVVLLHGNSAMVQDFDISGVLDLAAANHRVIVFDRPGFGYSERPRHTVWTPTAQAALLGKALQRLGVERPIVVGHSWGTLVGLALALDNPGDVAGLVLLSGYYFATARADVPLLSPPAIPVVGDVLRYTVSPVLGRLVAPSVIRKLFAPAAVPARFDAFPVALALRPSQLRASAADTALMIPAAAILSARYQELDLPVVILAGAGDRVVKAKQAERLHQAIPESELWLTDGAGHMLHHLLPQQVADAIELVAQRSDPQRQVRAWPSAEALVGGSGAEPALAG